MVKLISMFSILLFDSLVFGCVFGRSQTMHRDGFDAAVFISGNTLKCTLLGPDKPSRYRCAGGGELFIPEQGVAQFTTPSQLSYTCRPGGVSAAQREFGRFGQMFDNYINRKRLGAGSQ